MTLIGDKVYLRPLAETDLERTHKWVNSPEIVDAMSLRGPISREQQQKWFEALARDQSKVVFAICWKASDEHIGNVSLRDIDKVNRNAMFSIFIAHENYRGRGAGSEATRLILDYAFHSLKLHKVYLRAISTNQAAIGMYRKLGFVEEGCLREHEYHRRKYVDNILLGILAHEWPSPEMKEATCE